MTQSILIIGMGQGLSYAIAEKFGLEGFQIGMISRNSEKLQEFQVNLAQKGIKSAFAPADVSDTGQMTNAINIIKKELGTISILQYNAVDYRMKHLLEENVSDLTNGFKISVANAFAATMNLLDDLKECNGSVLLTGGGSAINPSPEMASISLGKAGLRNLAIQLNQVLKSQNVFVGIVNVNGMIDPSSKTHNPKIIAEKFWEMFSTKSSFEMNV